MLLMLLVWSLMLRMLLVMLMLWMCFHSSPLGEISFSSFLLLSGCCCWLRSVQLSAAPRIHYSAELGNRTILCVSGDGGWQAADIVEAAAGTPARHNSLYEANYRYNVIANTALFDKTTEGPSPVEAPDAMPACSRSEYDRSNVATAQFRSCARILREAQADHYDIVRFMRICRKTKS
jgi:hypothetical protein